VRTATHRFGCTTASIEDKLGKEKTLCSTVSEISAKAKIITYVLFWFAIFKYYVQ